MQSYASRRGKCSRSTCSRRRIRQCIPSGSGHARGAGRIVALIASCAATRSCTHVPTRTSPHSGRTSPNSSSNRCCANGAMSATCAEVAASSLSELVTPPTPPSSSMKSMLLPVAVHPARRPAQIGAASFMDRDARASHPPLLTDTPHEVALRHHEAFGPKALERSSVRAEGEGPAGAPDQVRWPRRRAGSWTYRLFLRVGRRSSNPFQ